MKGQAKSPAESFVTVTEIVVPDDTNPLNLLRGGRLLHWMDIASVISAQRHAECTAVTVGVDNVSFDNPIELGHVVTIQSKVTRAFGSSMEVRIDVWGEDVPSQSKYKTHTAYFTFVAIDEKKQPVDTPPVQPQSDQEKEDYKRAKERREFRLVQSGKLSSNRAEQLRELFNK